MKENFINPKEESHAEKVARRNKMLDVIYADMLKKYNAQTKKPLKRTWKPMTRDEIYSERLDKLNR